MIVSWYFPPVNTIGALRVGKFARFLIEHGHDVGVVAGKHWGHPETLPLGVPLERVTYAKSVNIDAPLTWLRRRLSQVVHTPPPAESSAHASVSGGDISPSRGSVLHRASELYVNLTNLPDNRIGWLPWAYGAGLRMCRTWQPDLLFASGPPFTALLAGCLLSARLGVPWVAELRDRWADDPYGEPPRWRSAVDQWLEHRVLESSKALITVTEPWAVFYRQKYAKPVAAIYNGYDPLDFDFSDPGAPPTPSSHVTLGYTGSIYPGRRDPTPLFSALRLLGDTAERFRVVFCGTDPKHVLALAERAGVARLVEVRPGIRYAESLKFQRQSDVLLLMQWNDPREQGNCPGKFFEYIASLRPILLLGLEDGVPAAITRERSAGFCSNDPQAIADQLRQWLLEKETFGHVGALPAAAREGLSRTIQFEKLQSFLTETFMKPRACTGESARLS